MALLREKVIQSIFLMQALLISVSNTMEKSGLTLEKEMLADCLMELNMSELLRLQRSLERIPELTEDGNVILDEKKQANGTPDGSSVCDNSNPNENGTCVSPQALQLTAEKRGYDHHPWQPEEKPSKLQTIFHVSITALSFLSFGAYLLCLIVQAIRSKGATYLHPVATTAATNGNGGVKRIKIYRRSRRNVPQPRFGNVNHVYQDYYW